MSKRVMVVDDDAEIVTLFEMYLSMHGFEVLTATSGRDAVARIASQAIDVLICDVRMPDMDGFEVVRAVREMGREFPICLHTAYDTFEAVARSRGADVQDVIFKPSTPSQVLERINTAMAAGDVAGSC